MPCLHKHPSSTGRQMHSLDTEISDPHQSCSKQGQAEGGRWMHWTGYKILPHTNNKQHFYR